MPQTTDNQPEAVVNALYEAALDRGAWSRALDAVAEWTGADAALVVESVDGRRRVLAARGHAESYLQSYRAAWLAGDPRLAGGGDASSQDDSLHRLHDFEREHGFACSFADRLVADGRTIGWLLLSSRDEAARTRVAIRYGRIRQHVERALLFARREAVEGRQHAALVDVADDLPLGLMLLEHDGQLRHANARARAVLERGDALLLRDGRLHAVRQTDDTRLQRTLGEAATHGEEDPAAHWLALPRRGGEQPYTLAVRVAGASPRQHRGDRLISVVIGDGARLPEVDAAVLAALFELTNREAQVCVRLLRGMSIDEVAADLGVSPRTARVYLQQVFTKLGVHRQAELVRLLLTCPAVLERARETPTTPPGAPPRDGRSRPRAHGAAQASPASPAA